MVGNNIDGSGGINMCSYSSHRKAKELRDVLTINEQAKYLGTCCNSITSYARSSSVHCHSVELAYQETPSHIVLLLFMKITAVEIRLLFPKSLTIVLQIQLPLYPFLFFTVALNTVLLHNLAWISFDLLQNKQKRKETCSIV